MRRLRLSVAALLATSLVLAGCGGDDEGSSDDTGDPKGTGEGAVLTSTWPLTGLDVGSDDSAAQAHPVLVVKMDNTSNSAPQIGLSQADMVVEELVEGGLTRLAVFYYSELPSNVGPIRSMRASDIGIVRPVDGEMVTSGAAGVTINRLKQAGIAFHGEGSTGIYRDSARSSLYSVMARLDKLAEAVSGDEETRPDDYLPWGDPADLPRGQKAKSISASFSGGHSTNWTFRGGSYHNNNSFAADGDEFVADTVLVLRVKVGDAGYRDPAGNPVPETKFEGKGPAMVFHDGRMVRGTWAKDDHGAPLELITKGGKLAIPPGHVWIELVPANAGGVTFR